MAQELDLHIKVWKELVNINSGVVSEISYNQAKSAVISQVIPINVSDLGRWILHSRHRADIMDCAQRFLQKR